MFDSTRSVFRCASTMIVRCALSAALLSAAPVSAGTDDEVRASFERFVAVQNAHDAKALESLLIDAPTFLWITRGTAIWGREAALKRFATLYEGTWKLEPDFGTLRVVPLADGVAQLYAVVNFTAGAAGQPPQVSATFLNQVLVKNGGVWRIASIFPIPAPAR